jgi:acetyltransferase-like isoleucine patch superfamily enzyme
MRRVAKAIVFAGSLIFCLPFIALVWAEKHFARGEALFAFCGQTLAVMPGFIGRWLRGAYYFGTLDRCSWEAHIGFGTLFTHRGAAIGSRVSFGAYCVVGHAEIGQDVMIGSRVSIPSGKRQHLDDEGRLAAVTRFERVQIGSHCWIGEGAIIMARIGERSIVSAGAVVSREMPASSLIGGNPAKVIREVEHAALAEQGA